MTKIRKDEKGLYCIVDTKRWRPWPNKWNRYMATSGMLYLSNLATAYKVQSMSVPTKEHPSKFSGEQQANTRKVSQSAMLVVRAMDNSFSEIWFIEDKE